MRMKHRKLKDVLGFGLCKCLNLIFVLPCHMYRVEDGLDVMVLFCTSIVV